MPATFPSHAAAVLPLKMWRPRWFDGVALVIGSAAPDMPYAIYGLVPFTVPNAHGVWALLWWCLPVTLVLSVIFRWAAPTVAAHLPKFGRFAVQDYGALGSVRHRWFVTVSSALVGSATHLTWDAFTHDPATINGWGARLLPFLDAAAIGDHRWWWIAQQLSTVVGAVIAIGFFYLIGRRRLIRSWHGPAPQAIRHLWLFWLVAGAVAGSGIAALPFLAGSTATYILGVRLLAITAIAALAGSLAVARRNRQ